MSKISFIIPCYLNEKNIQITAKVLIENESKFPDDTTFEYIMVNDGSPDETLIELIKFQSLFPSKVKVLSLVKNFGSSNAVLCGMKYASGQCCVVISADLQDPPHLVPEMFSYWQAGFKLVIAQKKNREDKLISKLFSRFFHNLMRRFALSNSPKGGFDLWLFDEKLKEEVVSMNERNVYIPYLFIWLGYSFVTVPYTRKKREIGKSGWTISKKIKSFIDSFVSFSFAPLRIISIVGIGLGFLSIVYALYIIGSTLLTGIKVEGWTSLMIVLLFVSSFIMTSLGIIGEYLYRTLDATRNRPNYIIDKTFGISNPENEIK